jgi:hypothetical protein
MDTVTSCAGGEANESSTPILLNVEVAVIV